MRETDTPINAEDSCKPMIVSVNETFELIELATNDLKGVTQF
jgi:hypothetical protein